MRNELRYSPWIHVNQRCALEDNWVRARSSAVAGSCRGSCNHCGLCCLMLKTRKPIVMDPVAGMIIVGCHVSSCVIGSLLFVVIGRYCCSAFGGYCLVQTLSRSEFERYHADNKMWRPSHQWLSCTLCSSNCVVNILNPYCTSCTPSTITKIKIMICQYF